MTHNESGSFRLESFRPDLGVGRFAPMRRVVSPLDRFAPIIFFLREGQTGWMGKRTDE